MSRKDDLDNHANQLNPNNDAYYSSRSDSGRGDDDDDYADVAVRRHYSPPPPRPVYTVDDEAQFTVVALNGQTCLGRVRISDTSGWNKNLQDNAEDKALALHKQVCEGVRRVTGFPIAYAQLTFGRKTVEELKHWEPTVPKGWSKHWERIDRKQWKRLERTLSYRRQAIEARPLIDQAAARISNELSGQGGEGADARARALRNAAQAFQNFAKAPIFEVNARWNSALQKARAMDVTAVVLEVTSGIEGLDHALRTVDVLVRASNARAPASLRHPASYGMYLPPSDAYGDYFGACVKRMDELEVWFSKGERRFKALLAVLASGKPRMRYDFGTYDVTMQPDFHIPTPAVERAMSAAKRDALVT